MREAKAADHRRRAYARNYSLILRQFRFSNVPALGTGSIEFAAGPSFICGGNGVGKSSLLHGLFLALGGEPTRLPPRSLRRLEGGRFTAIVERSRGGITEYSADVVDGEVVPSQPDLTLPVVNLLDPGPTCYRWLRMLGSMSNVDELLESVEPSETNQDQLDEIKYLVRKDYTARRTYEIEELDEVLPYVEVDIGAISYRFEDMGLGELALHTFHWQLSNAERDSVLLLEEPETFVSPRSQSSLVDLLCKYASERGLSVVVTTHSQGIIGRLEDPDVSLVYGAPPGVGVSRPPRAHQLEEVLGVKQQRKAVFLVEDEAALHFASALMDQIDPDLRFVSDIVVARGGAPAISAGLAGLPDNSVFSLVGIFDGGYDVPSSQSHNWPFVNLPGTGSPEEELRRFREQPIELASELRLDRTVVGAALAGVHGVDHHEWVKGLSVSLGVSFERLIDGLVSVWLRDPGNGAAGKRFCQALRRAIR